MNAAPPTQAPVRDYYQRAVEGHVFVAATIRELLDAVARRVEAQGARPRVLELGSHEGFITSKLLDRCPQIELVVSDPEREAVERARSRLAGRPVTWHEGPLETLSGQVDVVVSLARHHHLPHDYLTHVRRLLRHRGFYVLGDELCPEYCHGEHATRIARAGVVHFAGGYVLTSDEEIIRFSDEGTVPRAALELEDLRRRALWRWYRFVVDHAVERGYFDIATGELESTRDDLVTGSDAEHKFSPLIVERQLALHGFQLLAKQVIGPEGQPELQSMHVFEFQRAADG